MLNFGLGCSSPLKVYSVISWGQQGALTGGNWQKMKKGIPDMSLP